MALYVVEHICHLGNTSVVGSTHQGAVVRGLIENHAKKAIDGLVKTTGHRNPFVIRGYQLLNDNQVVGSYEIKKYVSSEW